MTTTLTAPFKNDIVGSFLRPQKLKEARKQFKQANWIKPV